MVRTSTSIRYVAGQPSFYLGKKPRCIFSHEGKSRSPEELPSSSSRSRHTVAYICEIVGTTIEMRGRLMSPCPGPWEMQVWVCRRISDKKALQGKLRSPRGLPKTGGTKRTHLLKYGCSTSKFNEN